MELSHFRIEWFHVMGLLEYDIEQFHYHLVIFVQNMYPFLNFNGATVEVCE